MAVLTPIATLNDNGRGVADLDGALAQAADTTNSFANDGNTVLVLSNGTAGSITATVKSAPDAYGRGGTADTNNDEVLTIAAGKVAIFPFLNPGAWNSSGQVTFTLSGVGAGMKIGIYRIVKLR